MAARPPLAMRRHSSAQRIGPAEPPSATAFGARGDNILFTLGSPDRLLRLSLDGVTVTLSLPKRAETESVKFIAQHPSELQQLAIATRRKSVFVSGEGGFSWKQIMRYGPWHPWRGGDRVVALGMVIPAA